MALPSYRDFLDRLQRDGVIRRPDPRTLQAVEELLDAGFAHNPAELAAALASLLTSTPEQWRQVEARLSAFLRDPTAFLGGTLPVQEPPPLPTAALDLHLAPEPGRTSTRVAGGLERLALSRGVSYVLLVLFALLILGGAAGFVWVLRGVDVELQSVPEVSPEPEPAPDPEPEPAADPKQDPKTPVAPEPAGPADTELPTPAPAAPTPAAPTPAPPPSSRVFLFALALLSTLLVAVGLRWILAPKAQRRRAMELHDKQAQGAQGPRVLYKVPTYPPFPLQAMDAAATLLARLPLVGHGTELDVGATLRATVRAGGRTTPVLAPTRASQELTILVDCERGDHPYLAGVEWLLQRWAQGGLRFVRLSFEHHPTVLWTHPDRRQTNLDALGRRTEGSPLILFARATQLREYEGGHGWLTQLGPWPVRAIVDLDPREQDDPALLREERDSRRALARARVRRFPFTAAGLAAMAHHVGSRGLTQVPVPDERLRPAAEIREVLDRWASCLACVPDPSWAQLEVFRREFFAHELPDPRYVQRLLDHVSPPLDGGLVPDDPLTADGTRIDLPRPKVHRHLARLSQADPLGRWRDLEVRAREVIMQQLRGAEPRAEGDRRLRDLKLAEHEAILKARDPQLRGETEGLEVFIGTAQEEDLEHWVADQVARHRAARQPLPGWLRDLQRSLTKADLQLIHLGQWLRARGLAEVAPYALLLGGLGWLTFGAGARDVYSLIGLLGTSGGALAIVVGRARRGLPPHPWHFSLTALVLLSAGLLLPISHLPGSDYTVGAFFGSRTAAGHFWFLAPAIVASLLGVSLGRRTFGRGLAVLHLGLALATVGMLLVVYGDEAHLPAGSARFTRLEISHGGYSAFLGSLFTVLAGVLGLVKAPRPDSAPHVEFTPPEQPQPAPLAPLAPPEQPKPAPLDPTPPPTPAAPAWPPPPSPLPTPEKLGPITAPPTGRALGVVETALADVAPIRLVGLTGGDFTMGSPDDEPGRWGHEGPQHRVFVSPFAIAEHPVTQGQWKALMGENPSDPDDGLGDDLPVTRVSWFDALEFLNRLSAREGRRPCYRQVGPERWTWDRDADGFRLPTEAEWEYAARAGTKTAYSFDDPADLGEYAWYLENAERRLHPVGGRRPNPWHLFDMHGHVWEWTWDSFDKYVNQATVDPPRSLETVGGRVLRGGSFVVVPRFLRSADRLGSAPTDRDGFVGFRCVRGSRPQP